MARLKKDDTVLPSENVEVKQNKEVVPEQISVNKEEVVQEETVSDVKEELSFEEKEKMLKKQLADLENERVLKASPKFIDVPAHILLKQTNAIRPSVKDPVLAKVKEYLRKGRHAKSSRFNPIEINKKK